MRATFIKIVASLSLALGLLGPQVASGQQLISEPEFDRHTSSELIVVSSSPAQEIITETSVLSDCGPVNSFLDRMDILIWQVCGSVSVTDEFDLPTLAVTDSPVFVPSVAVKVNEVNLVANDTLNPVQTSNESGLIPISFGTLVAKKVHSTLYSVSTNHSTYSYIENSQNFFTTVSMRC